MLAMTNRVMVVTVAAMALAVSCLVASGSAAAFTARDMLGRDVALAAPPKRIISLVPSVTEILYALHAEHLLVGVTDFCDFPPEAKRQPKVGGMVAPSLEAIIALKPDLVIATTEGTREDTFTQLSRVGVPVYLVAAHHVADATSCPATGRASSPVSSSWRARFTPRPSGEPDPTADPGARRPLDGAVRRRRRRALSRERSALDERGAVSGVGARRAGIGRARRY